MRPIGNTLKAFFYLLLALLLTLAILFLVLCLIVVECCGATYLRPLHAKLSTTDQAIRRQIRHIINEATSNMPCDGSGTTPDPFAFGLPDGAPSQGGASAHSTFFPAQVVDAAAVFVLDPNAASCEEGGRLLVAETVEQILRAAGPHGGAPPHVYIVSAPTPRVFEYCDKGAVKRFLDLTEGRPRLCIVLYLGGHFTEPRSVPVGQVSRAWRNIDCRLVRVDQAMQPKAEDVDAVAKAIVSLRAP